MFAYYRGFRKDRAVQIAELSLNNKIELGIKA